MDYLPKSPTRRKSFNNTYELFNCDDNTNAQNLNKSLKRASSGSHSPLITSPKSNHHKVSKSDNNSSVKSPKYSNSNSNSPLKSPSQSNNQDRYIPSRNIINFDYCNSILSKSLKDENINPTNNNPTRTKRNCTSSILQEFNISTLGDNKRLISCFDTYATTSAQSILSPKRDNISSIQLLDRICTTNADDFAIGTHSVSGFSPNGSRNRVLPTAPSRILDAPDLLDDYYLNLLHWGNNNIIAIALHQSVYLWHAEDGKIDRLVNLEGAEDHITSVQWCEENETYLAVGTSFNNIEIWDCVEKKRVRVLTGHINRVSSLSWSGLTISSGSRDSQIINHDIRLSRHIQSKYTGHEQEVCGLTWSTDGMTLASGGNENLLCIWDARKSNNINALEDSSQYSARLIIDDHNAAVKALSWCPYQRNVLASGGGTADRTIRIWNTALGTNLKTVDTGSQVCSIQWNSHQRELVSSHGFSDNQLILWKYPTMTKVQEFTGHTSRVLHLAKSPSGGTICSASADETLRFWDIFENPHIKNKRSNDFDNNNNFLSSGMMLR